MLKIALRKSSAPPPSLKKSTPPFLLTPPLKIKKVGTEVRGHCGRCFLKFCKIDRKATVLEFLLCKVAGWRASS